MLLMDLLELLHFKMNHLHILYMQLPFILRSTSLLLKVLWSHHQMFR